MKQGDIAVFHWKTGEKVEGVILDLSKNGFVIQTDKADILGVYIPDLESVVKVEVTSLKLDLYNKLVSIHKLAKGEGDIDPKLGHSLLETRRGLKGIYKR